MRWSDERLKRAFDIANRRYWDGALPACYVANRRTMTPPLLQWASYRPMSGFGPSIFLDADAHGNDWAVFDTLLHEMAHHAAPTFDEDGHNEAFMLQIERLLEKGAPILPRGGRGSCFSPVRKIPASCPLLRRILKHPPSYLVRKYQRHFEASEARIRERIIAAMKAS